VDEHDDNRTHGDIRELSWIHVGSNWETRVGVRKVFWGVTEGRHLVDIINQTDAVDQVDGEEKLGQPMINLSVCPTLIDGGVAPCHVDLRPFAVTGRRRRWNHPWGVRRSGRLLDNSPPRCCTPAAGR